MSYNNILDADAALRAVTDFQRSTVAIIKHTNTCGLACNDDQVKAYNMAFEGDPVSAFGGIVAFNRMVTLEVAEAMSNVFYEIVIAPDFQDDALALLKKKRDLRILSVADHNDNGSNNALEARHVSGGILLQTQDILIEDPNSWQVVTIRKPTDEELEDMAFAWKAVKHIKSNAIVLVKDGMLLGMGAGQPNRVNSVNLAVKAAGNSSKGSILASDAFFPFADGLEAGAEGGIVGVVQPGGSIRDNEVIDAADKLGLVMVFTGIRHFRH
jgi:phosphoribosylaminoimidazolecarboxamide formyltransferase/IMP cyclohydrolase